MMCRHISVVSDVQHTGFRKMNVNAVILHFGRMFEGNCKIIFHHPQCHISVFLGLTFYMIQSSFYPNNRIRDDLAKFFIMLIAQLFKFLILGIGSSKNLVDQWNQQKRHFLSYCPKHIIKNRVKTFSAFHIHRVPPLCPKYLCSFTLYA